MRPLCRNIQNDEVYEYLGGNEFRNLRTGVAGIVETEKAREIFRFNVEATQMAFDYPIVEELIMVLNLKFDNILKTKNE